MMAVKESKTRNSQQPVFSAAPPQRRLRLGLLLIATGAVVVFFVLFMFRDRSLQPIPPVGSVAEILAEQKMAVLDETSLSPSVDALPTVPISSVAAAMTAVNHPPRVTSVDVQPKSFYSGIDLTASAEGSDQGNDLVGFKYRWFVNDQHVVVFDDATLTGDQFYRGDRLSLEVVAYDTEGDGRAFRTADVIVPNGPPSIVSSPPGEGNAGRYEYLVQAVDPDGDEITYSLEESPVDMSIDPGSGLLIWPIKAENVGVYSFRVVASDPEGMKSSQEYTLNLSLTPKQ